MPSASRNKLKATILSPFVFPVASNRRAKSQFGQALIYIRPRSFFYAAVLHGITTLSAPQKRLLQKLPAKNLGLPADRP